MATRQTTLASEQARNQNIYFKIYLESLYFIYFKINIFLFLLPGPILARRRAIRGQDVIFTRHFLCMIYSKLGDESFHHRHFGPKTMFWSSLATTFHVSAKVHLSLVPPGL